MHLGGRLFNSLHIPKSTLKYFISMLSHLLKENVIFLQLLSFAKVRKQYLLILKLK